MAKDPELERLFSKIATLEAEYGSARSETDFYREQMNREWSTLDGLQREYRQLKEQADEEFRSASLCWEMGDRASAKEHSDNGKALNERKAYLSSGLDMAHSRFDPLKDAFERAKARQAEVLERLKSARAAKNRRLDELKAQRAAEEAHWHEKGCQGCGATIRYRDTWSHVPNYCKDCKASFKADGYKLRFNPSTGKNDFFFGTDKPKRGDGHGHVVVDDGGNVRYVRDRYDPKRRGDREDAVSYDDKTWL